jgi:hypothetical protein
MLKYFFLTLIVLIMTSCLQNLNVTEFFRKLKIKSPQYYEIISANRSEIENSIKEHLEKEYDVEIERVLYWGEGSYACGKAVITIDEVPYVTTSGYYFIKENPEKKNYYNIKFIPNPNGQISNVIFEYYYY